MRYLQKQIRRYLEISKRAQDFPFWCAGVVHDLQELRKELIEMLRDETDEEKALIISLLADRARRDSDTIAIRASALLEYMNNSSKHP